MRWIKHLTAAHRDERLGAILDELGLEGYGFWWLLLEVIGHESKGEKCDATYSLAQWSRLLYCHHHKASNYLGKLADGGLVSINYIGDEKHRKIKVIVPNLLKYRDEYSKKSGQAHDKDLEHVPSDSGAARDSVRASISPSVSISKNLQKNEEEKKKPGRAREEFPEDYQPPRQLIEKARAELGLTDEQIELQRQRCVNHHRAKGNTFKRLDVAFWNWISGRFVDRPPPRAEPAQRSLTDDRATRGKYDDYVPPDD